MPNDYYQPASKPVEFTRARAGRIAGELDLVEGGFARLPTLNRLMGNAQVINFEASGSTANAIRLTGRYPFTSLELGQQIRWVAQNSNTGPVDITVDNLGPRDLLRHDNSELEAGDIRAGLFHEAIYDGHNWIMTLLAAAATGQVTLYLNEIVPDRDFTVQVAIGQITFPAAIGGTSPYTYQIVGSLPAGLDFDGSTRVLSGTPTALGTFSLTYQATDSAAQPNSVEQRFELRVLQTVLALPNPGELSLTVGSNYSITLPQATGGTQPHVYAMQGVPQGLSFNPDPTLRRLFGVPSTAGTFSDVQYSVTDADGDTITQSFRIRISDSSALSLSGVNDQTFVKDTAIQTLQLPAATGGLPSYSYTVTGLPAGLSFDTAGRTITGTPTALGTSEVTYTVTDQNATSESVRFNVMVVEGGRRYVFVVDQGTTLTAAELQSGTNFDVSSTTLTLPVWVGNKLIGLAQPRTQDDLTYISLSGVGNAFSQFTKQASFVTVAGTEYEIWLSNDLQGGGAISGSAINVQ